MSTHDLMQMILSMFICLTFRYKYIYIYRERESEEEGCVEPEAERLANRMKHRNDDSYLSCDARSMVFMTGTLRCI